MLVEVQTFLGFVTFGAHHGTVVTFHALAFMFFNLVVREDLITANIRILASNAELIKQMVNVPRHILELTGVRVAVRASTFF